MSDEEVIEEETEITAFDEKAEETEAEAEETEATGEEPAEEPADAEETAESESPSPTHIPIAALTAERRKRQEAAEKLEHYEDIPDPVEQPKEYAEFVRAQAQTNTLQDRINLSRSIMVDMDPEYETLEAEFMAAVATEKNGEVQIVNQDLFNQFQESANPAKFARDMGKSIKEYREKMAPDYEQKLRAKWEAERAVVPDLTTATSEKSNSTPDEKPAGLDSIFEGSPL